MAKRETAMETYVAFMRAINVGGRAVVTMSDLQEAFRVAGCQSVRTYIQSGNVVFAAPPGKASALFKKVAGAVSPLLGGEPTIIFRTVTELERVVESDPFRTARHDTKAAFYVTFLAGQPKGRVVLPLVSEKEALEVVAMTGLDAFTISRPRPNGFYGFPNNYLEKQLGVAGTTRKWSTVSKIVEFARSATEIRRSTAGADPPESGRHAARTPAPRRSSHRGSRPTRSPKA
jgi:uncharacterized protein (DUF1697 family)